MENLNAEQVKSDLAICVLGDCQACHYNKFIAGCRDELCGDALALINSQEQRIGELGEDNERLRAENERYAELEEGCYVTGYKNIKADTLRELQNRLEKYEFEVYGGSKLVRVERIGEIAKEMLEGENNG